MGRGGHSDDEGTPYDQRLEEVEFMRSACVAAQRGDVDKLRAMLHRRPDIVTNDGVGGDSGYTPLHYAAREGHAECVRVLLASGANANARTRAGGATPLHRAAFTGEATCVRLLLDGGADPCARDADGESARPVDDPVEAGGGRVVEDTIRVKETQATKLASLHSSEVDLIKRLQALIESLMRRLQEAQSELDETKDDLNDARARVSPTAPVYCPRIQP